MGNSQPKYFSTQDAQLVLGMDRWRNLRNKLSRGSDSQQQQLDFETFSNIILTKYSQIPQELLECLYKSFASDSRQKIDIDSFICAIAATFCKKDDVIHFRRLLFRIYESQNALLRPRIEHLLTEIHGRDPLRRKDIAHELDGLFGKKVEVSLAHFEHYSEELPNMSQWVTGIFRSLFEPAPNELKLAMRKYCIHAEAVDIAEKYSLSPKVYALLREGFLTHYCHPQQLAVPLSMWIDLQCPLFLSRALALIIFFSRLERQSAWKFQDWLEYVLALSQHNVLSVCEFVVDCGIRLTQRLWDLKNDYITAQPPEEEKQEFTESILQYLVFCIALPADKSTCLHQRLKFEVNKSFPEDMTASKVETNFQHSDLELLDIDLSSLQSEIISNDDVNIAVKNELQDMLDSLRSLELDDRRQAAPARFARLCSQLAERQVLPGLDDLILSATALFGAPVKSPSEEMKLVTELTLRYMDQSKCDRGKYPFGPAGTQWSLVSCEWLNKWKRHVGRRRDKDDIDNGQIDRETNWPGPVSNDRLLLPAVPSASFTSSNGLSKCLRPYLSVGHEFEAIPPPVMQAFFQWYGGGPEIIRQTIDVLGSISDDVDVDVASKDFDEQQINSPLIESRCDIEYYPLSLVLFTCDSQGQPMSNSKELLISRSATVGELLDMLAADRKLTSSSLRLWPTISPNGDSSPLNPTTKLNDFEDGQQILLEREHEGVWPLQRLTEGETDTGTDLEISASPISTIVRNSGLVGFDNLGNTCYLNASLQCLLHCDVLTEYFLSQKFLAHLNVDNPLGCQGRLARVFARIVSDFWSTKRTSISPRYVLQEIASLREQFKGNSQHDAHELLAFLLDGLSEDLCLVKTKPYVEQPDSDDRSDNVLADIWWSNHLLRENSFMTSLFAGQFKSVSQCKCGYNSARFEPFTVLSLPIPEERERVLSIIVVPRQLAKMSRCAVRVDKESKMMEVLKAVLRLQIGDSSGECRHFVIGEIAGNRIRRFLSVEKPIDAIRDNDELIFFEVEFKPTLSVRSEQGSTSNSRDEADQQLLNSSEELSPVRSIIAPDQLTGAQFVRIALAQRHVLLADGAFAGCRGFVIISMEPLCIPLLEVLPSKIDGSSLYRIVYSRLKVFLKGDLSVFKKKVDKSVKTSDGMRLPLALADSIANISTASTQDLLTGPMPSKGFTLRLVTGGEGNKVSCSRCPWLSRCDGCVIPDRNVDLELRDGESIAIDWHITVCEEILKKDILCRANPHPSFTQERERLHSHRIPISQCLEKFSESETMDDVICPRCKESDKLTRQFSLWRLPPVLVVQLKRFQFNRVSRKKLNQRIEFSRNNLDLKDYLAPSRLMKFSLPGDPEAQIGTDIDENDVSTKYQLASVIHHEGVLGGGHYVATVRTSSLSDDHVEREQWTIFNDHAVTSVNNLSDISDASAYVLFYVRKDYAVNGCLDSLLNDDGRRNCSL